MRLILDTNIFVSILIRPNCAFIDILEYIDRGATLLYSVDTLAELVDVLHRRKFAKYTTTEHVVQLIEWFTAAGELVEITRHIQASRDPKDDKFLSLLVCGKADCLVTGDKRDLVALGSFENVPILSPSEFLMRFMVRH